jgi:hypothetical protein
VPIAFMQKLPVCIRRLSHFQLSIETNFLASVPAGK